MEEAAGDEEMSAYGLISSIVMTFESDVQIRTDPEWRERRMRTLHESIKVVTGPLQKVEVKLSKRPGS